MITKNESGLLLDEIFIEEQYRNKGIGTSIIKDVVSKSLGSNTKVNVAKKYCEFIISKINNI